MHDKHPTRELNVLASHNLSLNRDNSIFSVPATEFVGFHLTADGLGPLYSNRQAVQLLPDPSCPAFTTPPGRGCLYVWLLFTTPRQQLTSPPVLAHFDLTRPTFLTSDASSWGCGPYFCPNLTVWTEIWTKYEA